MKTLNRIQAEDLLKKAAELNNGNWIKHSYNVAHLAEKIAVKSGMNSDNAYIFGLLHDIGRREGTTQARHSLDGYNYLIELEYEAEARICLTHTFQYQNIDGIYDGWDCSKEELLFISNHLKSIVYDDYDKLIQLCDALSTADGYCYAEKKMVSSIIKFGFKNTTIDKWKAILELKSYFDNKCKMDIYLLFDN